MTCNIFFIVGCSRSGTTALVKILNTAVNAEVFTEQEPKLCINARINYEFGMPRSKDYIKESKSKAIKATLSKGKKYMDKNPNYLFFIDELMANFDCKFIFVIRDGRDVVRSAMDYDEYGKNLYRTFEDEDNPKTVQPEEDFWDFARLRPKKTDTIFYSWKSLTRFEKASWYWAKFNGLILKKIEKKDKDRFITVDISNINLKEIEKIFNFAGLEGFNRDIISKMLKERINSAQEKWGLKDIFPKWDKWDNNMKESFSRYAGRMMKRLGYNK